MNVCRMCGSEGYLQRGLCRECRHRQLERMSMERSQKKGRRSPSLEPAHSRPWVHRLGG